MLNATRFKTLMLREWLQNRWTWLIAIAALPVLVLVSLPFGDVQIGRAKVLHEAVALIPLLATPLICMMVAWATTLFMASGLARRDVQDRSIEFWLSLPATHAEHIGAQYLMHAFVFPLLALALGLLMGLPLSLVALVKFTGSGGVTAVAWGEVLQAAWLPLLLAVPGLLLLALWMSPIVLGIMATSAWMKRLALPLLAVAATFLANFPSTAVAVRQFAGDYFSRAGFLVEGLVGVLAKNMGQTLERGQSPRAISGSDYLLSALQDLASAPFALGLTVAVAAAALIALKRRRG